MFFAFLPESCQLFAKQKQEACQLFAILDLFNKEYKDIVGNICSGIGNYLFLFVCIFRVKFVKMANYSLRIAKRLWQISRKYLVYYPEVV